MRRASKENGNHGKLWGYSDDDAMSEQITSSVTSREYPSIRNCLSLTELGMDWSMFVLVEGTDVNVRDVREQRGTTESQFAKPTNYWTQPHTSSPPARL